MKDIIKQVKNMGKKSKKKTENHVKSKKHKKLYVRGMHCAACEVMIERALIKKKGVVTVDASLKDNAIDLRYTDESDVSIETLNREFKDEGYTFSDERVSSTQSISDNAQLIIGTVCVILLIMLLMRIMEIDGMAQYVSVDASSTLIAFLILGVVAGLSSCAALVGGLLLSMTKQWSELVPNASSTQRSLPHILFHTGRLVAFFIFGGLLGLLGNAITFNSVTLYAILIIIISGVMMVLGCQMIGARWAQNFSIAAPKFLTRYIADESNFTAKYMPFVLGAGTFFLPCGFTLIAQGVALTTGSFLSGSLIMLLFALGTLPILLGISFSGIFFSGKASWSTRFNVIAGVLVLMFGIYNISAQLNVLGLPSLSDVGRVSENAAQEIAEPSAEGEQELHIIADKFVYVPTSSTTLKAGVPTTLIVDNKGAVGCAQFMAARGLLEEWIELKPGENTAIFTPEKGTYKLTCTMGMVDPITITVVN